ncbi:hypothetical protein [Vreelandella titanicae]|jgi:hypothetical protein|uniref:hypothetical protein n=1 Tax=Vreelandella titanicae TaxID=664683 RepID=UPI0015938257|nr:hypothetical protein [Halomonas titanicae]NVE91569.1 hypothetical protein [Halomonas titanicae]|tara:strand:+ start:381 stop:590 length:210 start_codon:yes stop_codon:yes gene_type:complete
MSELTKASTKAMITIELNGTGGFTVYAGFNGEKPESPQLKQAGQLALLGMLAIKEALEEVGDTTKTTIH